MAGSTFDHPAQQIVFQDHVEAINVAQVRLAALEQQLREIVPTWTMVPVVAAYQALRSVSFLVAITLVAEVGDVRRRSNAHRTAARAASRRRSSSKCDKPSEPSTTASPSIVKPLALDHSPDQF
jgi:transposase